MPAHPKKLATTHLTQVKVESSYGAETSAIATADTSYTFHTRAEPVVTPMYQYDGALEGEGSPGGSARPNIGTTGRAAAVELPFWWRSCTGVYSGTVFPDAIRALRGHGLSLAFGSQTLTLAPQRTAATSVAVDVYLHGELEHLYGVHFHELEVAFASGRVPEWVLRGQGLRSVPTDAAVPALGYQPYSRDYAKFVTASDPAAYLTTATGAVTVPLVVREGTWKSVRPIDERLSSAETGESGLRHPGVVLGNEVATFEGVIEATTLSTVTSSPFASAASGGNLDVTQLYETGALFAFGLQSGRMLGGGQHGFKITGPTSCFTAAPVRQKGGAAGLWEVAIRMNASTDVAADAYSITAT